MSHQSISLPQLSRGLKNVANTLILSLPVCLIYAHLIQWSHSQYLCFALSFVGVEQANSLICPYILSGVIQYLHHICFVYLHLCCDWDEHLQVDTMHAWWRCLAISACQLSFIYFACSDCPLENELNNHANFENFPKAFMTLFRCATVGDWVCLPTCPEISVVRLKRVKL